MVVVFDLIDDLALHQGSDYSIALQLLRLNGTPVDLTGKAIQAQAKTDFADNGGDLVVEFDATVIDALNGVCLIEASHEDIDTEPAGYTGRWDLEVFDVDGRERLLEGQWAMTKEVTR